MGEGGGVAHQIAEGGQRLSAQGLDTGGGQGLKRGIKGARERGEVLQRQIQPAAILGPGAGGDQKFGPVAAGLGGCGLIACGLEGGAGVAQDFHRRQGQALRTGLQRLARQEPAAQGGEAGAVRVAEGVGRGGV